MAQLGRALRSGRRGRRFKSCRIDFKTAWAILVHAVLLFIIILFQLTQPVVDFLRFAPIKEIEAEPNCYKYTAGN